MKKTVNLTERDFEWAIESIGYIFTICKSETRRKMYWDELYQFLNNPTQDERFQKLGHTHLFHDWVDEKE